MYLLCARTSGSQAAAVAVAAAAAVLDTDDAIRNALSQLHLGSSSGHLLHAAQKVHDGLRACAQQCATLLIARLEAASHAAALQLECAH
jgi:hypothetical protein